MARSDMVDACCYVNFIDCQCTHGDVHLVGGAGDYEGNVQVCVNSTWGHVCDDGWGSNEAEVVCLQLGYSASSQLTIDVYRVCIVLHSYYYRYCTLVCISVWLW